MSISREDIERTMHLSSRDAAQELGVKSKTTINDYRKKYGLTFNSTLKAFKDGDSDLSTHAVTYGYRERELASGEVRREYTVRAVPNKDKRPPFPGMEELVDTVAGWDYQPTPRHDLYHEDAVFVVCAADFQVGKVSDAGGSKELEARVKASFDAAATKADSIMPKTIVLADLGDIIENFYNTSGQRESNDLSITEQVRLARQLMAYGIKVLAPHCLNMVVVGVPSNHASVRIGPKALASTSDNDWGLEINVQLQEAFAGRDEFQHVTFLRPEPLRESVNYYDAASNTNLGFVHGHQAGRVENLHSWWQGQTHGRQATGESDILLTGHFHSMMMRQSGDSRWIMVAPASDNGSDWYTNLKGETSLTGMLTFTAYDGMWYDLEVL